MRRARMSTKSLRTGIAASAVLGTALGISALPGALPKAQADEEGADGQCPAATPVFGDVWQIVYAGADVNAGSSCTMTIPKGAQKLSAVLIGGGGSGYSQTYSDGSYMGAYGGHSGGVNYWDYGQDVAAPLTLVASIDSYVQNADEGPTKGTFISDQTGEQVSGYAERGDEVGDFYGSPEYSGYPQSNLGWNAEAGLDYGKGAGGGAGGAATGPDGGAGLTSFSGIAASVAPNLGLNSLWPDTTSSVAVLGTGVAFGGATLDGKNFNQAPAGWGSGANAPKPDPKDYGSFLPTDGNPGAAIIRYEMSNPKVAIAKGDPGDDTHTVQPGSQTVTATITNSGNEPLTGFTFTDVANVGTAVSWTIPADLATRVLQPGATLTITGTVTVTAGQTHKDTATITAKGTLSGTTVTASDPTTLKGMNPRLTVVKKATVTGDLHVGDTVTWTYTVTNTGDTTVRGVAVSDDRGVPVTCPATTLEVGASMDCHGTGTLSIVN